jgi:Tol biopolymer transport system component
VYSNSERPPNQWDSNLWVLRVEPSTGRPRGQPRRLTDWRGFNFIGLSFSGDGKRLAFDNFHFRGVVQAQPLSASSQPVQLSFDDRADSTGGWSRDSKAVYYISDRSGSDNIYRQVVGEHSAEDVVESPQRKSVPALSPDGKWLLYMAWPPDTDFNSPVPGSLMRIPVGGGSSETVMPLQLTPFPSLQLPDFRCAQRPGGVCVLAQLRAGQVVFSTFDPMVAGGKLHEVATRKVAGFRWDLSPDGTQLAIAPRNESAAPV